MAEKTPHQEIGTIVEKMSGLARLRFDAQAAGRFAEKVRAVLAYVEQLGELDTSDIEPTSHAVVAGAGLREDAVHPSPAREAVLTDAPARDGPFVQVPKVIDDVEP